ncbi:enoyl-CoA hydratase/isomerase family protein [Rouxiella sp. WC2420]|uniref:Enoyl-CoA hydratase/isomerase family protein n=1 Tax=Rouxiella sp. WC2420 TaxID=3234145 RepID=A0AB39VVW5_9GAMM
MSFANVSFDYQKFQALIVQPLSEQVMLVTLNRTQAHNAYNANMVSELGQIVAFTEATVAIKVVILTGAGEKVFCAGADLKEAFIDSGKGLLNAHGGYNPLQYMPRRKVWIAALNGHAFGGGLELALHCDLLVAEEKVQLALPETRHSLLPLGGGITQLAALLPAPIVKEMILAGGVLEANRAYSLGLINRVTDSQNLLSAACELAEQVTRNAPLAVQAANTLLEHCLHGDPATLAIRMQQELEQLQQSEDFTESSQAFKEKREPLWKGK